jgi:hypothetical protein
MHFLNVLSVSHLVTLVFNLLLGPITSKKWLAHQYWYAYHSLRNNNVVATICNNKVTIQKLCPHHVLTCSIRISEHEAIIFLYNRKWLVFITEIECLLRGMDWIITSISAQPPLNVAHKHDDPAQIWRASIQVLKQYCSHNASESFCPVWTNKSVMCAQFFPLACTADSTWHITRHCVKCTWELWKTSCRAADVGIRKNQNINKARRLCPTFSPFNITVIHSHMHSCLTGDFGVSVQFLWLFVSAWKTRHKSYRHYLVGS